MSATNESVIREPSAAIKRVRSISGRYGFGFIEQILIALLNFGIVIATGRLLSPALFAVFVVIMSSLTLGFGLVGALVSSPVLVLYRKRYHTMARDYLGKLEITNVAVSLVVGSVCLGISYLVEKRVTPLDFLASLFMLTTWSSYELRRKIAYAISQTRTLFVCSAGVLLTAITLISAMVLTHRSSVATLLLCLSFSYLAGIVLFRFLAPPQDNAEKVEFATLLHDHWIFSRSLFSGLLLYWLASQGYFLVAAGILSDATLGGVRTVQNIAGMITTVLLMFENQATPIAATIAQQGGDSAIRTWVQGLFRKGALPFFAFVSMTAIAAFIAHHFIYRKTYADYSWLAFIFAFHQFLLGLNRPYAVGLKAIEKTTPIFWGHCAGAGLMVVGSWLLISYLGALGVAVGFIISASALLVVLHFNFWRITR